MEKTILTGWLAHPHSTELKETLTSRTLFGVISLFTYLLAQPTYL